MKKEDITYQEKLNELRLDISHPNSSGINFVLLEGDSDIRLFRKFFDLDKCKVENIPGGKLKLEECVGTLVSVYPLILGIRDADFKNITDPDYSKENIFLTDYHDIEMTMVNCQPVLNAIVFEYSGIPEEGHSDFRDKLMEIISSIGFLKLLNETENLKLSFTAGFQDLIDFTNGNLDFAQYIQRVIGRSPDATIDDSDVIQQKVSDLRQSNPDMMQVTNGHDLLNAFAKYFREVESRRGVSGEVLEASLRMVYNKQMFEETTLFKNLTDWEELSTSSLF